MVAERGCFENMGTVYTVVTNEENGKQYKAEAFIVCPKCGGKSVADGIKKAGKKYSLIYKCHTCAGLKKVELN